MNKPLKRIGLSVIVLIGLIGYAFKQRTPDVTGSTPTTTNPAIPSNTNESTTPTNSPIENPATPPGATGRKDGTYVGNVADAFYGNIQVQVTIKSGNISDVKALQFPDDRPRSSQISADSLPQLRSEAIQAQSADIDIVSGATQTSIAYRQSLSSALSQSEGS